jgi:hypothetical protein
MATRGDNPPVSVLEQRLADLAADWRAGTSEQRERLAKTYAETLDALYARGWDDLLDVESMLPDAVMPPAYGERHPEAARSDWRVSLSRPFGRE